VTDCAKVDPKDPKLICWFDLGHYGPCCWASVHPDLSGLTENERETFEARAAAMEFDANLALHEAELRAFAEVIEARFANCISPPFVPISSRRPKEEVNGFCEDRRPNTQLDDLG
jgi:hypothetical protein